MRRSYREIAEARAAELGCTWDRRDGGLVLDAPAGHLFAGLHIHAVAANVAALDEKKATNRQHVAEALNFAPRTP